MPEGNKIERRIQVQPEVESDLEKDRKFIDWLQERISSSVLKQQQELLEQKQKLQDKTKNWLGRLTTTGPQKKLAVIEKKLFEMEKLAQYISSEGFRKELANWQPWRLNEKSVETGKNLYIRAAKGYAGESFLNWTKTEAEKHSITQNQFLAGVIETVRKTEWETMKVMASKNIATEYMLPHIVIGKMPMADVFLFNDSLKEARKKAPEKKIAGLFSKEEAENQEGLGIIAFMPYRLTQELGETGGGAVNIGAFSENIIGIYDQRLKELFDPESNYWRKKEIIQNMIVEEEVHHQKYKDSEVKKGKDDWFKKNEGQTNVIKESEAGQEIEEAVGIKKTVTEVAQELPPLEKLLEPFNQRISRK